MKRTKVLSTAALMLTVVAFNMTAATKASAYGWGDRTSSEWDSDERGGNSRMSRDDWRRDDGYGSGLGWRSGDWAGRSPDRMGWSAPCSSRLEGRYARELRQDRMTSGDDALMDRATRRALIRELFAGRMRNEGMSGGVSSRLTDDDGDGGATRVRSSDVRDLILERVRSSGAFDDLLEQIQGHIQDDDD